MSGGQVRMDGTLLQPEEAMAVLRTMLERAGWADGQTNLDDALAAALERARDAERLERELARSRERIAELTQELSELEE